MSITTSKFPVVSERTDLVSSSGKEKSSEVKHAASKEIPVLFQGNNDGESLDIDAQTLIQQVSRSFIGALHQDTTASWDHLHEVLVMAKPYSQFFQNETQIYHYVERVRCFNRNGRKVPHKVVEAIIDVFPNHSANLNLSGNFDRSIKFPGSEESVSQAEYAMQPKLFQGITIPRGKPVIPARGAYILEHPDNVLNYFNPRPLCIQDLKQSLPAVVREISKQEAALGLPLGKTEAAIDTNLPQACIPTPPGTPRRSPSLQVIKSIRNVCAKESSVAHEGKNQKDLKTGREIVELFVKGAFVGELKFAYLNHAPSKRYDPYNLIEVPKENINQEHFVISSHSILHVRANQPSESYSLAEWYKEACQYQAVSKIGFFKNFLISKMFRKWKLIKIFSQFLKLEGWLERSLIHNVPSFGSALLRISSLLQDLSKVTFLPFETNECYTLAEFEEVTFRTIDSGKNYVKQFFEYCQIIVNMTQDNCFDYLHYCQAQVRRHVHNYRDFLTVSKQKRMVRQNNLKLAHEEIQRLGTFAALVDQIIATNLLSLAQSNVCKFINRTMPGPLPQRIGLFCGKLVFNDTNQLVLSPPPNQLTHVVSASLKNVLGSICTLSHAMKLSNLTESTKVKENAIEDKMKTKQIKGEASVMKKESTRHSLELNESLEFHVEDKKSGIETGTRSNAEVEEDLAMMEAELTGSRKVSGDPAEEYYLRQDKELGLLVEGDRFQQYGLIHSSPLNTEKLEAMLFLK